MNINILSSLEQLIFNLNPDNVSSSILSIIDLFDENYPYSFVFIICRLSYSFYKQCYNVILLFHFLKEFEVSIEQIILKNVEFLNCHFLDNENEEEFDKNKNIVIEIFTLFLLNLQTKESFYLLEFMINEKLIGKNTIRTIQSDYFRHHNKEKPIYIFSSLKQFSKNDWELREKYIKEGVNPNEIAKIIRNDEIEKLQEISSQANFDFNQRIEPSLYERCSFINQKNVTLIDYAAFFGSVKCFKYLLMNGANANNTGKYAVAGENEEIIHLCLQCSSSFNGALEASIEFHRNDIFHYILDNDICTLDNINALEEKCIIYDNYNILFYLFSKNKEIKCLCQTICKNGNLYLMKYFMTLEGFKLSNNLFPSAVMSGNIELVKYILEQGNVDINSSDVILIFFNVYLIFLVMFFYLF